MSEDDIPPARFAGRTYSRVRNSSANRIVDEAADARTVQVKAAMSISKWGKANYVPVRDSSDGATEPKKQKMESKGEDPFSFDTEDKRKSSSAAKQDTTLQEHEPHQPTKLPASRISVKGEVHVDFRGEKEEAVNSPAFRTYSRTASKKPIIMDQFVEVGRQMPSGQTVFFSEEKLAASTDSQKRGEDDEEENEDDDFFPVQFKREPLKTYSGEVVTPVDKPDSPPPRKSGYKRKGGPRGRKPLTVSDPELIEQYKRNYAAQQLQEKPDASTKGMNNSTVVFKQELANEAQGTTVVVVCKPKAQVDAQTKYVSRNSKQKGTLVPLASDATGLQATPGENGNAESSPVGADAVPTRTSARLRNVSVLAANSEGTSPLSVGSDGTLSLVNPSATKRASRGRHSNISLADPATSSLSPAAVSSESSSQGDASSGRGGKRYRIFKSRAPQVEEELQPPVFKDDELNQMPASFSEDTEAISDNQVSLLDNDKTITEQMDVTMDVTMETVTEPLPETAEMEVSKTSEPAEPQSNTELEEDASDIKNNEPVAAREQLAARLRNVEKGNETDSIGEPDNASECSEHLTSQESPSNSQCISEEGSQKEGIMVAPRKFFKSKKSLSGSSDLQRKIFGNSPQKSPAKATYNARSWYNKPEGDQEVESHMTAMKENDDGIVLLKDSAKGPKLKREVHWPTRQYDEAYTSLKVNKTHKELYTVVHNVKQTHEVQELGETQDFMDEVDYLLDSLRDTNSTPIRCLSCLKLAGKCISPAFRMHLRAHGTVTKIFSLLHDACSDPCLALSTSAMMFMLSRDRLNMDLDQDSLNLMLRLNELDAAERGSLDTPTLRELEKAKQKVMELLAQLQQETHAREIDLGFVSTGNLAMESLLSLTSRRAGEWFKEELRSAGGLDYIVDSVTVCENSLPEDISQDIQKAMPVLKKLDRCLRVLENISSMNSDNQNYLISYKNAALLQACTRTLRLCQTCMPSYKMLDNVEENKALKELPGYTILTCMLAVLRVLLNVTHENQLGNLDLEVETSLMETIVRCLTTTHWCVPMEQRFDLAVLCLGLLINLVEHRESNRQIMMILQTDVKYTEKSQPKTMSAIKAVVELFVQREEAARQMEEDTVGTPDTPAPDSPNKSGEWKETEAGIQWITNNLKKAKEEEEKQKKAAKGGETSEVDEGNQSILEDDEETFTKALHKAGKHMENSIVASYAGLLLGSTIVDNKEYAAVVKKLIPNEDFGPMIKMLKKFLNFMSLTTAFGSTDVNGITKVIDVLETA